MPGNFRITEWRSSRQIGSYLYHEDSTSIVNLQGKYVCREKRVTTYSGNIAFGLLIHRQTVALYFLEAG